MTPAIEFDQVWKKFRRGERHDSLRDLIPAALGRLGRGSRAAELGRDDFWVLRDVSFQVMPGEALGIIGQNGAGKSTALKLLTRILKPTRGRAAVRGRVGALIEVAAGFHPDLTGRENVFLQGAIMGMTRAETRSRFDSIVDFAALAEFIDTPVKRYSSGMNARLGFSIAAHLEPEVLLIDEVLAVGDFTFQQKCYERLREFRRNGTAIAFVSHNMQAVASLCDRALLLRAKAPAVLDKVEVVTAAYAGGTALPQDPRVDVRRSSLVRKATGEVPPAAIVPGEPLVLTCGITARERLPRVGVVLQLVRADGVVMFTGMSTLDGGKAVDLEIGDALDIDISFVPNLLRGTYTVNVHFVDEHRTWSPVVLNGMAAFVVSETTRTDGCAEVFPEYRIQRSLKPAPVADALVSV